MIDSEPPVAPAPRRRSPRFPYREPHGDPVWLQRAQDAAKAITRPMTPSEATEAIGKALHLKEHEAVQILAAADGVTLRWAGGVWMRMRLAK